MCIIDLAWCDMYTTSLPGMWYQIKQKQQMMPKARANINVYSSRRIHGLICEDQKAVPYDDDTRNCMVCGTKSDRPPCFVLRKGPSMPRRNWSIRREEPSIAITADLGPFVTHTGLTVNTALLTRHHEGSPPQFPCRTWTGAPDDHRFFIISPTTVHPPTSSSCCLSLIKEASYTHTVLRYRYGTLL